MVKYQRRFGGIPFLLVIEDPSHHVPLVASNSRQLEAKWKSEYFQRLMMKQDFLREIKKFQQKRGAV